MHWSNPQLQLLLVDKSADERGQANFELRFGCREVCDTCSLLFISVMQITNSQGIRGAQNGGVQRYNKQLWFNKKEL